MPVERREMSLFFRSDTDLSREGARGSGESVRQGACALQTDASQRREDTTIVENDFLVCRSRRFPLFIFLCRVRFLLPRDSRLCHWERGAHGPRYGCFLDA